MTPTEKAMSGVRPARAWMMPATMKMRKWKTFRV